MMGKYDTNNITCVPQPIILTIQLLGSLNLMESIEFNAKLHLVGGTLYVNASRRSCYSGLVYHVQNLTKNIQMFICSLKRVIVIVSAGISLTRKYFCYEI